MRATVKVDYAEQSTSIDILVKLETVRINIKLDFSINAIQSIQRLWTPTTSQ